MDLKKKTNKAGKRDGTAPKIQFGKLYRDHITGFEGRCVGFCSYISGCDQVCIQPPVNKDGEHQTGRWLDDDRLIDVEAQAKAERTSTRGGPQDTPAPTK